MLKEKYDEEQDRFEAVQCLMREEENVQLLISNLQGGRDLLLSFAQSYFPSPKRC